MDKYLNQLLSDILYATENISLPYIQKESYELHDWISEEEEEKTAPIRNLEDWTGIRKEELPPGEMLSDEQLQILLAALKKMLDKYNWSFVLQTVVPERIQYAAIRDNFDQQAKVKQWHMRFFELCKKGTEHGKCALGKHCECAFFDELFSGFTDEDLTPQEERERELQCEVQHIKKKYGDEWMKYYPYHLDKNYDDAYGNSYDYGFGIDEEDDDNDDWWKK